jgi:hypothetical protein
MGVSFIERKASDDKHKHTHKHKRKYTYTYTQHVSVVRVIWRL